MSRLGVEAAQQIFQIAKCYVKRTIRQKEIDKNKNSTVKGAVFYN